LPLIGLAIPGLGDLATYKYTIAEQIFAVGDFLAALITFVIVAFVVFVLVKITKKWGIE
jgi:large-conductance mechanosensitive channel